LPTYFYFESLHYERSMYSLNQQINCSFSIIQTRALLSQIVKKNTKRIVQQHIKPMPLCERFTWIALPHYERITIHKPSSMKHNLTGHNGLLDCCNTHQAPTSTNIFQNMVSKWLRVLIGETAKHL